MYHLYVMTVHMILMERKRSTSLFRRQSGCAVAMARIAPCVFTRDLAFQMRPSKAKPNSLPWMKKILCRPLTHNSASFRRSDDLDRGPANTEIRAVVRHMELSRLPR